MAKKQHPRPETGDLHQIRNLLFGEQALQTEERFSALENAINSLRRENRQLRQALEVEAMSRIEADNTQNAALTAEMDGSLHELSHILMAHLENETNKRRSNFRALAEALDSWQSSQDEITSQLIRHLQNEQQARSGQFSILKDALTAQLGEQVTVSDSLSAGLASYAEKHEYESEAAVDANTASEEPVAGD